MMSPRLLPLALSLLAALPAQAQSLLSLYESARAYDASFQSAQSQYQANVARVDQAVSALLPSVGWTGVISHSQFDVYTAVLPPQDRPFGTKTSTLAATQPLYRPANWAVYQQGQRQLSQAQAQLASAEQDLMVRVSQAYFDVLASQDSLRFVRAQKSAVAEQLAAAKRNFEVGVATITDTREAQARFDLVLAQEIAAENDLRVKQVTLNQLVGNPQARPLALAPERALPEADAGRDADAWVAQAEDTHPAIVIAREALEVARLETDKAKAGHKPTVDLNASYSNSINSDGSTQSTVSSRTKLGSLGVTMSVPLFAGFATQNRIKETLALEDKARTDLEAARRTVALATRTAYLGLVSGQGQVKALQAAEASSQSALDANKLGYNVGVRINIDVLNAQSQLFQTKRDLAKARYDLLLGSLKLRQANGSLSLGDLQQVNTLLQP